jgi:CheY-like chemotaxis protein
MPKYVLCADDSVTMQKVVAITFANSEFAVMPAKNADEALALARNHKPDLVLADASMPGRSGYDLCQSLKADPNTRNIPVVILCGNSSPYDDVKGRQVGADSFLVKPWDTTLFLDKLAEIMGRAQSHGVAA